MPTDDPPSLPFALITRPSAEPVADDLEARRHLLARRRPPRFLGDHQEAARRYRPSDELLLALNMALHTGARCC